jgi:hypothetical protein
MPVSSTILRCLSTVAKTSTETNFIVRPCKSQGIDQILAELNQAGGETLYSEIHKLVNSIWNKEELPDRWKESIIVPICKMDDKTDCNNYRGILLLFNFIQNFIQYSSPKVKSIHR